MRKKRIEIRVSENEYKTIVAATKESNMTVSEYLRAGIGEKRYKPTDDENLKMLTQQLSRIGNNLNQLVVIERTKGNAYSDIEAALKEIMALKKRITEVLSNE